MNLMRMLKPGKWKILSALLAGALALACVQCSVRSLVYLPPQPKDKTVYLEKRAAWEWSCHLSAWGRKIRDNGNFRFVSIRVMKLRKQY